MREAGHRILTLTLLATVLAAGCLGDAPTPPRFVDVSQEAGLTYVVDGSLPHATWPMDRMGGGVAVGDVDDDGWPDLYIADAGRNVLYLHQGNGSFHDATRAWHAVDRGMGRAPALFDMDNDGDLDLFVGNYQSPSHLYENVDGRFRNATVVSGIHLDAEVLNAAVADVDGNGYLDLFVGVYGNPRGTEAESYASAENGGRNRLYLNQGNGTFREAGREWGLDTTRWAMASAFTDLQGDGLPDLYVANDFGWDELLVNTGDGFRNEARERGIHVNTNGMGATWFDADADADLDLYVTAIFVPGSPVPTLDGNDLLLREDGRFTEAARRLGVADGGWSWHAEALDVEHDGDEDLYVANGFHSRGAWDAFYDGGMRVAPEAPRDALMPGDYNATHEYYFVQGPGEGPPTRNPMDPIAVSQGGHQGNRLFLAGGDGGFRERAGALGANLTGDSRAAASLDFDRDGDLDLVVTAAEEPVHLLENRVADRSGGHWLQVELDPGPGRPAVPVGARVTATAGDRTLVREVWGPSGFMTQSQPVAHLGLGTAEEVEEVTVRWPWGETTTVRDVAADQRLVVEPGGTEG